VEPSWPVQACNGIVLPFTWPALSRSFYARNAYAFCKTMKLQRSTVISLLSEILITSILAPSATRWE
jgi:hypothetical protein